MQVIAQWTGAHADALRRSMRMGNESFAEYLGVVPRTVANWRKMPEMIPQPRQQAILDTALERASDQQKAKFAALADEVNSHAAKAEPLSAPVDAMTEALIASEPDPDERARVHGVLKAPSRLDAATVANLTQVLYGQRHAEDTLGPSMLIDPMKDQLETLVKALRDTSGPQKAALMHLVANWTTFVGWLHTALREYPEADAAFATAEEMSDELADGVLASTATSFRGYIALLQDHHRGAIRTTAASLATPGAHPTQVAYDTIQSAQAYAGLGDAREARSLLRRASDLATNAGEPPASVYWYTEPFLRMNIGLAQHAIGEYREAVDSIRSGLAGIPADQQNSEWANDYQKVLDDAAEKTDKHPAS
jgi:tetratricopeptide (TPR) repeat protein